MLSGDTASVLTVGAGATKDEDGLMYRYFRLETHISKVPKWYGSPSIEFISWLGLLHGKRRGRCYICRQAYRVFMVSLVK